MVMTAAPQIRARRATVEDLPQLISLWQLEQLPTLEKRFTEFQVVSDDAGQVLGAIGLQISGAQGMLYGEAMAKPEMADLQAMIHNHALERIWTPSSAPYWRGKGFAPATSEQLEAVPADFRESGKQWQVLTLRTPDANAAIEREFARMQALQQEEKLKLQATVSRMKRAALIALFFLMLIAAGAMLVLRYAPQIFKQQP
jgi:hypothetical protein